MRIGVLTGGGDCPGLNAVIRAVVRKGVQDYGHEFVGFRDGWKGPLEGLTMPLDVAAVRGILPRGGTILGSSRTNPFKIDGGVEQIEANLADARASTRSSRSAARTPSASPPGSTSDGRPRGRRAQDHRQRPRRDRLHLRLRHRGQHRDRGHRPAAHHGRVAPPRARRRGHGPARRLDRAALGHRRRRQRDPHPRAAVRHRRRSASGSSTASAASYAPIVVRRRGRAARTTGRPGRPRTRRSTRSGTCGCPASASGWRGEIERGPARRPAPRCSATSSAAARRPRSTAGWPPGSGCTRSTRSTRATGARWSRCRGSTSCGCRSRPRPRELKTVPPELYAEADESSSADARDLDRIAGR